MKFQLNKNLFLFKDNGYILIEDSVIPYNPNGGTKGHFLCLSEIVNHPEDAYVKNVGNCPGCRRIIATEFMKFKLDGIPQFKLDTEINQLSRNYRDGQYESIAEGKTKEQAIVSSLHCQVGFEHGFKYRDKEYVETIDILKKMRKRIENQKSKTDFQIGEMDGLYKAIEVLELLNKKNIVAVEINDMEIVQDSRFENGRLIINNIIFG